MSKPNKQKTEQGHEIPVPKRSEFFDNLKKAATPHEDEEESTPDDTEKE